MFLHMGPTFGYCGTSFARRRRNRQLSPASPHDLPSRYFGDWFSSPLVGSPASGKESCNALPWTFNRKLIKLGTDNARPSRKCSKWFWFSHNVKPAPDERRSIRDDSHEYGFWSGRWSRDTGHYSAPSAPATPRWRWRQWRRRGSNSVPSKLMWRIYSKICY